MTSFLLQPSSVLPCRIYQLPISSNSCPNNPELGGTHFSCAEKSSLVSSSSQLSSHKCVFPLGKSVFSSVQSVTTALVLVPKLAKAISFTIVPSAGKSSNSSSSSSFAAGFCGCSLVGLVSSFAAGLWG